MRHNYERERNIKNAFHAVQEALKALEIARQEMAQAAEWEGGEIEANDAAAFASADCELHRIARDLGAMGVRAEAAENAPDPDAEVELEVNAGIDVDSPLVRKLVTAAFGVDEPPAHRYAATRQLVEMLVVGARPPAARKSKPHGGLGSWWAGIKLAARGD